MPCKLLTESDTKGRPRANQVVLQRIVEPSEDEDEDMKKDNGVEEEPTATLVDHPEVPALLEAELLRIHRLRACSSAHSWNAHETLHALSLCLVPLQVRVPRIECDVRVGVEVGGASVGEVEARGPLHVVCHSV